MKSKQPPHLLSCCNPNIITYNIITLSQLLSDSAQRGQINHVNTSAANRLAQPALLHTVQRHFVTCVLQHFQLQGVGNPYQISLNLQNFRKLMQNHGEEFSINGNIQSKTSKIHERVMFRTVQVEFGEIMISSKYIFQLIFHLKGIYYGLLYHKTCLVISI